MRVLRGMENLLQKFRLGLRTLRKNPGFADWRSQSHTFADMDNPGSLHHSEEKGAASVTAAVLRLPLVWLLWGLFLFEEAADAVDSIGGSFAGVFTCARS